MPLVPSAEKRRFWGLLLLTVIMALIELAITGLVALLAAVFGSLEAALNHNPLLWVRTGLGFDLGNDARYLALGILCAILLAIVCKNGLTVVQQWHMYSGCIQDALAVTTKFSDRLVNLPSGYQG